MEYLLGAMYLGWIQQMNTVSALSDLTELWETEELGHTEISALGRNIQVLPEQIRRGSGGFMGM